MHLKSKGQVSSLGEINKLLLSVERDDPVTNEVLDAVKNLADESLRYWDVIGDLGQDGSIPHESWIIARPSLGEHQRIRLAMTHSHKNIETQVELWFGIELENATCQVRVGVNIPLIDGKSLKSSGDFIFRPNRDISIDELLASALPEAAGFCYGNLLVQVGIDEKIAQVIGQSIYKSNLSNDKAALVIPVTMPPYSDINEVSDILDEALEKGLSGNAEAQVFSIGNSFPIIGE